MRNGAAIAICGAMKREASTSAAVTITAPIAMPFRLSMPPIKAGAKPASPTYQMSGPSLNLLQRKEISCDRRHRRRSRPGNGVDRVNVDTALGGEQRNSTLDLDLDRRALKQHGKAIIAMGKGDDDGNVDANIDRQTGGELNGLSEWAEELARINEFGRSR